MNQNNLKNIWNKKKKFFLIAIIASMAVGMISAYIYNKTSIGDSVRVSLKDFATGSKVEYKIVSNDEIIQQGQTNIAQDGMLNLVAPSTKNSNQKFDYHLAITSENNEAETLDLLLNIDKKAKNIVVKGSGLDEFSPVSLKNGESDQSIFTDWAGGFQAEFGGRDMNEKNMSPVIEMAFQNAGIQSDLNALGNGKVEVFLGEDLDYDLGDVRRRYGGALNSMTQDLSALMVKQTMMIGAFMDASIQLKTQRKMQELHARAHKDYHPSEQMCRFGTFMRSVAHSERKSEVDKHALNRMLMDKYKGMEHSSTGSGPSTDANSVIRRYAGMFCDSRDNGGATHSICSDTPDTPEAREQRNADIDYTRILANQLTLDINFADGFSPAPASSSANNITQDEQSIVAMARNLYFPQSFASPKRNEIQKTSLIPHHDSRSYAAKMSVAHSSFVNIVGMKSSAPVGVQSTVTTTTPAPPPLGTGVRVQSTNYPNSQPPIPAPTPLPESWPAITDRPPALAGTPPSQTANPLLDASSNPRLLPDGWRALTEDSGWAYMKALMMEFGITDENSDGDVHDEIDAMLGERPSYYAQMEVLTKKIYQSPNFYTNLYDKPTNVARIGASIDAITLMNQRDRYESMLRQEMLSALLVEEGLAKHVEDVNSQIYEVIKGTQIRQ